MKQKACFNVKSHFMFTYYHIQKFNTNDEDTNFSVQCNSLKFADSEKLAYMFHKNFVHVAI